MEITWQILEILVLYVPLYELESNPDGNSKR